MINSIRIYVSQPRYIYELAVTRNKRVILCSTQKVTCTSNNQLWILCDISYSDNRNGPRKIHRKQIQ